MIASGEPYEKILRDEETLKQLIYSRLENFFLKNKENPTNYKELIPLFPGLSTTEYLVVLIAAMPAFDQGFYQQIIGGFSQSKEVELDEFLIFGGRKGKAYRGILPTIQTALFILAQDNPQLQFEILQMFQSESTLIKNNLIELIPPEAGEPFTASALSLSEEAYGYITTGKYVSPRFSSKFPAKKIESNLNWQDVVLNKSTMEQIDDLRHWLKCVDILTRETELGKKMSPGYRVLFHGPPGTGKTMTGILLGQEFNKEVYRIDLSQVVSKYIGETEKNLERLFQLAENKDWILFFDEADALFGKRTQISDAHDRYANQNVSYLLQRIENYPGLIILASNYKSNIDKAFARRFKSIIKFPMPTAAERVEIFNKAFPKDFVLNNKSESEELLTQYELSGGNIWEIVVYACIRALNRESKEVRTEDIIRGVKRELAKEGRAFKRFMV